MRELFEINICKINVKLKVNMKRKKKNKAQQETNLERRQSLQPLKLKSDLVATNIKFLDNHK